MNNSFVVSPESVMEYINLKSFRLYENGKLIMSTKEDAYIIMQFDTKQIAKDWLVEHFDKLQYLTGTTQ
ncbi:MAG: hypothetical protein LBV04_07960 [Deferribacteraceae bacterium]|jgi:hypothetical protein|nr:hypothetical protein [Deferribacteraceae bacterium]